MTRNSNVSLESYSVSKEFLPYADLNMGTVGNSPLHNLFVRNLKIVGLCDDGYPDDPK